MQVITLILQKMIESVCKNCSCNTANNYCPNCGQKVIDVPLTWKSLFSDAAELIDVNKGFVRTSNTLFKSPHLLVREYLSGKTQPYNSPVKYLFTVVGLLIVIQISYKFAESVLTNKPFNISDMKDQLTLLAGPGSINMIIITPLFNFIAFRNGLTLVEHIVISLFEVSMLYFILVIMMPDWSYFFGYDSIINVAMALLLISATIRFNLKVFTRVKTKTYIVLASILYFVVLFAASAVIKHVRN